MASLVKDLKYPICRGSVPDFSQMEDEVDDDSELEETFSEQDLKDLEGLPDEPSTNYDPFDETILLSTI